MKESFAPIKKRPAYAQVFDAIEQKILTGALSVGETLPTEHELCEQFGVQRSTVREGVRLLEQSGLVRRAGGKRLQVARPRRSEEAQRARQGLTRHGVTFAEVWETLFLLTPQIARKAATGPDHPSIEELEAIAAALKTATEAAEVVALTSRFYEALSAAAGNRVIDIMVRSLNMLTRSSIEQVIAKLPEAGRRSGATMAEIAQAIADRDPDRAAAFTERHIADLRRGYDRTGVDIDVEIGVYEAGASVDPTS